MTKAVTFGEMMLRLNPKGYFRFVQATDFEASYAGTEANVAVSLANFGIDATFVSKLPKHEIGQSAINSLRQFGVNTIFIKRGGPRIGVYYVEKGASQRPSKVIYDRENSSISLAVPEDFDWEEIFDGAQWFHFSGITPALGGRLPEICEQACQTAKKHGIKISCDLNYRAKLWTREEAGKVMGNLMKYVDVCIANEEDIADVFGIKADSTNVTSGKLNKDEYVDVAKKLSESFGLEKVAITLRGSISASINEWSGILFGEGKAFFAPNYTINIVDRVGGGDSFAGALVYSLMSKFDQQDAINFAVAASCLKQTINNDFNAVSVNEVKMLVAGNASGRVQR